MGTSNSVIQPLQKIPAKLLQDRLVLLAPRRHHHPTLLLEKLHWLPIQSERIKYKVACMCFSAIHGSGPASVSELLHVYTPSRTLRSSSDTRMLKIQQYKQRLVAFAHSLALVTTFRIHSHKTLDTAQPCHLLKPLTENFFFSHFFFFFVCVCARARLLMHVSYTVNFENNLWTKGCNVIVIKNRCHY